eukprot:UN00940
MKKRLDFLEQFEVYGFEENMKYCQKLFTVVPKEVSENQVFWRFFANVFYSGTLNMFVKPIENFLEAFEKKVSAQKMGFCQNIHSR